MIYVYLKLVSKWREYNHLYYQTLENFCSEWDFSKVSPAREYSKNNKVANKIDQHFPN